MRGLGELSINLTTNSAVGPQEGPRGGLRGSTRRKVVWPNAKETRGLAL